MEIKISSDGDMEAFFITSRTELDAAVAEAVETAILRVLPDAIRRATLKPYLTKKELMELTGWSDRQVEYKKANREISFVRRGRSVLFPSREVTAYLNEGYVPARRSDGR